MYEELSPDEFALDDETEDAELGSEEEEEEEEVPEETPEEEV